MSGSLDDYFRNGIDSSAPEMLDPRRRAAVFQEMARDFTTAVNRGQSITRAMEKAFRIGVSLGQANPDFDPAPRGRPRQKEARIIEIIDLGPKAREAFLHLTMFCFDALPEDPKKKANNPLVLRLKPAPPFGGGLRWQVVKPERWAALDFAERCISPAVKLGLLTEMPESTDYMTFTQRGLELARTGRTSTATSDAPVWRVRTPDDDHGPSTPKSR